VRHTLALRLPLGKRTDHTDPRVCEQVRVFPGQRFPD
jgi:hypothetical protein